jgi:tetratricopeptide (TPR) repeat protein
MSCLLFAGVAFATNPDDEAAQLFQHKQYKEALDIWYGLVESGDVEAGIYYNIGVSESLLGQTPKAVLAFEKAIRFKPCNHVINKALVREREKIENAVIPVPAFFLMRWFHGVLALLRPGYWALTGLFSFLLIIVWIFNNKDNLLKNRRRLVRQILIMFIAGVLFLSCAGLSYSQIYRTDEAIIVTECIFRQAPSDDSPQIRVIFPGEKVTLSDQIGNWYQVRLLNLDEGWVKKEALDFILIEREGPAKD